MSKSVGNVVDPVRSRARLRASMQVRYFFLREVTFGQDGNYSREAIVNRINADLANDLGNLAQRSLSMIAKNCEGKIPEPGAFTARLTKRSWPRPTRSTPRRARRWTGRPSRSTSTPCGRSWRTPTAISPARSRGPRRRPTSSAWRPILYVTAEVVRQVAILVAPVMPTRRASCSIFWGQARGSARLRRWAGPAGCEPGTALPEPQGVFPRYVEPAAEGDGTAPEAKPAAKPAPKGKERKAQKPKP